MERNLGSISSAENKEHFNIYLVSSSSYFCLFMRRDCVKYLVVGLPVRYFCILLSVQTCERKWLSLCLLPVYQPSLRKDKRLGSVVCCFWLMYPFLLSPPCFASPPTRSWMAVTRWPVLAVCSTSAGSAWALSPEPTLTNTSMTPSLRALTGLYTQGSLD